MTIESINWIEHLLRLTCQNVQLNDTQVKSAEEKYGAISKWLGEKDSPLLAFDPVIYPQGSLVMGTTVKPIDNDEYDLDLVCLLNIDSSRNTPAELFSAVLTRMRANAAYNGKLTPGSRHIRIDYAKEFHLDIVPACPDKGKGGTYILIPDKPVDSKLSKWRSTNPKGFADWFKARSSLRLFASKEAVVEPFPEIEEFDEMSSLKHSVQLIKRWRSILYKADLKNSPSSILLSTIIADKYTGTTSLVECISNAIAKLELACPGTALPSKIYNPSNNGESLNDVWFDNAGNYTTLASNIKNLKKSWNALLVAQNAGIDAVAVELEKLFGEDVRAAVKKHAELISGLRKGQRLGLAKTGKIVVYGTGVVPTFSNPSFYGK